MDANQNELILYQPDNSVKLEVMVENETVWLTQAQIAVLTEALHYPSEIINTYIKHGFHSMFLRGLGEKIVADYFQNFKGLNAFN